MFDSKRWIDAVVSRSDLLTEEAVVFGDKELCYREAYPHRGGYLVKGVMLTMHLRMGFIRT